MIERRSPHQVGKDIAKGINNGNIKFFDKHLSMGPSDLVYGYYTKNNPSKKLDVAVIEATAITPEGGIVPGASVGASPEIIQMADKIIIEVNTASPDLTGLHDIVGTDVPPYRKPYLVMSPEDRIGLPYIPVDPEKVVAIVESDYMDQTQPNAEEDETSRKIASNLVEFLLHEVKHGRLPQNLTPLQSGIGNIANAVVGGLASGGANFKNLKVWTEVLQDSFLDLFDSGNLDFATATSIRFSPDGFKRFYDNYDRYAPKLLLRPQSVSNSPEIIKRLGVVGMNTPVEVDIYAHANSTCVMGSRMLNGLGGSADFLRNSKYSIMHTPSTRPSKTDPTGVSCIVPMCTHVDQTEHDRESLSFQPLQCFLNTNNPPSRHGRHRNRLRRRHRHVSPRARPRDHQEVRPPRLPAHPDRLPRPRRVRVPAQGLGPRTSPPLERLRHAQAPQRARHHEDPEVGRH